MVHTNVLIDDDFLSQDQKETIRQFFDGLPVFPFYVSNHCVHGDGIPSLIHEVVSRKEEGRESLEQRINSSTFDFWQDVLSSFLQHNNMEKAQEIRRICVNGTFASKDDLGVFHIDHEDDYKHLIVYLNDSFSGGGRTVIKNEDGTLQYIDPKRFRGACFEKCMHAVEYPKDGLRIVVVFTFL